MAECATSVIFVNAKKAQATFLSTQLRLIDVLKDKNRRLFNQARIKRYQKNVTTIKNIRNFFDIIFLL